MALTVSERIQLVEDIWDSVAEVPESIALTDEQKAELDGSMLQSRRAQRSRPAMMPEEASGKNVGVVQFIEERDCAVGLVCRWRVSRPEALGGLPGLTCYPRVVVPAPVALCSP